MGAVKIYLKKFNGFDLTTPDLILEGDYEIGFEDYASVIFSNKHKQSETIFVGPTADVLIIKTE